MYKQPPREYTIINSFWFAYIDPSQHSGVLNLESLNCEVNVVEDACYDEHIYQK